MPVIEPVLPLAVLTSALHPEPVLMLRYKFVPSCRAQKAVSVLRSIDSSTMWYVLTGAFQKMIL